MDNLKEINKLENFSFKKNSLLSVYDYDGQTLEELLIQYYNTINETVDLSNKALSFIEWCKEIGVPQETQKLLNKWLGDGTLENLINLEKLNKLKNELKTNIDENRRIDLEEKKNINSQLETKVNIEQIFPYRKESVNNGIDIQDLDFELQKVEMKFNDKIIIYEDKFTNNIENYNIYEQVITNSPINTNIKDVMTITNTSSDYDFLFKIPIKLRYPSLTIELEVLEDTFNSVKSIPRVGLVKDNNNWVLCNNDHNTGEGSTIIRKLDGAFLSSSKSAYKNISAPYKILVDFNNNIMTQYIEKDNILHRVTSINLGDIGFHGDNLLTKEINMNTWNLAFGGRAYKNGKLVFDAVKIYHSSGMCMGADFKPITYEDGCPIRQDGKIFFTGSNHSTNEVSGGGNNIYSLDISTYEVEFLGRIYSRYDGHIVADATVKIFYDRRLKNWVFNTTNFSLHPMKLFSGMCDRNLLKGIHVVDVVPLNIQGVTDMNNLDSDIVYIKDRYYLISCPGDNHMALATSVDNMKTWELIREESSSNNIREGTVFTKVNGQYYITRADDKTGLYVYDFNFNKIGKIKTDVWAQTNIIEDNRKTPSWGCVIPIQNNTSTEYILLSFSLKRFQNYEFGYGDLWIYRSRQRVERVEYSDNRFLLD